MGNANEGSSMTQIDAARAGTITREMAIVAEKEGRDPEFIREGVAAGRIAIPANIHHTSLSPEGVGGGLRTKVNVNLGISGDVADEAEEWKKVDVALELGADYVINGKEEDTVARIRELTGGHGADLGIETAGSQITAGQLIRAAKKGATIVFVGYSASGEMTLPIGMALDKELTFKTVFRYRNIYPMAIEAVAGGRINIKNIVTDYFELDDIKNALDSCVNNKADIVKGVIKVC